VSGVAVGDAGGVTVGISWAVAHEVFGEAGNQVPVTALQIKYVGGATAVPVNPTTGVKTTVDPLKT
jgi:hypothetical protein